MGVFGRGRSGEGFFLHEMIDYDRFYWRFIYTVVEYLVCPHFVPYLRHLVLHFFFGTISAGMF